MSIIKLHTLIDLFNKEDVNEENTSLPLEKIEIPIIQRDYAQGRNTPEVNRIRKRFLTSLYDALTQDQQLKLDFVYGDINGAKLLTPLDGQQRLTTLFLLHWYIGRHEKIAENKIKFLARFSYKTRYSARTFCEQLVKYVPDFGHDSLSDEISDQNWMPLDWQNDPTISAMLNMLDDIHKMFKSTNGLWERLEKGCISFYFLSIGDMGLTDELYIKMNSRGKPLTEFEHFKAEWESNLKDIDKKVADRISRKIDLDWTDMLWPYKGDNNIIDDEFVRYFKYLCAIIYYKKYPTEIIPSDIFDLTKDLFAEKKDDALENLEFIEKSFDCFIGENINSLFESFLTQEDHLTGKSPIGNETINVFEDCCNNFGERRTAHVRSFSIGKMILLYAFILYLKHKENIDETTFAKRLRIINNMIKASEFELRDDRMNALLEQTEQVILEGEIIIIDSRNTFNSLQVQEEYDKKEWIASHSDMEETLNLLEDHSLLNGGMSVIGLNHVDYTDRFYSLFNCNLGLVNLALLSLGDYSLKISWRYQIGSDKKDVTWRSIFHTNKDNVLKVQGIICKLLDQAECFDDDLLISIISEYLASATEYDWRYYIIKYDSMRPEKYGMYYWYDYQNREKDSYNILMMLTEKSIGGRNFNIFLKTLYDAINISDTETGIRLGEYAYSNDGNVLELTSCGKNLYYTDSALIIVNAETSEIEKKVTIPQDSHSHRDIEDRVEIGLNEIRSLLGIKNNM